MSESPSPTEAPPTSGRHPTDWPESISFRLWRMRAVRGLILFFLLAVAFTAGQVFSRHDERDMSSPGSTAHAPPVEATTWTCSMHPQVKLPGPGQCPLCFMDLIPVSTGTADTADLPRLQLSSRGRTLARVETAEVRRQEVGYEVRIAGKVAADETRITYISSYVPGRLDRLYVDYTGMWVRKGDHLAEIYSPDLLVAQREYLIALETLAGARSRTANETQVESAESLMRAARRKMELWAVPQDQIDRLERDRQPSDHIRIDAPTAGWVLQREGFPGMYVETGTRLFTVADLQRVWVLLDAYELDVGFLRYGQSVQFETDSVPGRVFGGQIAYIDPVLNENTRTVRVRVNVTNTELLLRPGMFVRARVMAQLGEDGRVVSAALAGKWICPMHPEIVKEAASPCDECGMDLVPVESLGYATRGAGPTPVLAIPQSAVLLTGRRAVVYVEQTGPDGELAYEGRMVELGPRAGDLYVILSGLREGDRVVTRGAVQIDSALQIQARPSLMQPSAAGPVGASPSVPDTAPAACSVSRAVTNGAYHETFRPVIAAYLDFAGALAADDPVAARKAIDALKESLNAAVPSSLSDDDAHAFRTLLTRLSAAASVATNAPLDELRRPVPELTAVMEEYLHTFGHDRPTPLYRLFCPMARENRGAYWLDTEPRILNPYFGASMLRCGEVKGSIAADGKEVRGDE